jgi:hypothetical protein
MSEDHSDTGTRNFVWFLVPWVPTQGYEDIRKLHSSTTVRILGSLPAQTPSDSHLWVCWSHGLEGFSSWPVEKSVEWDEAKRGAWLGPMGALGRSRRAERAARNFTLSDAMPRFFGLEQRKQDRRTARIR